MIKEKTKTKSPAKKAKKVLGTKKAVKEPKKTIAARYLVGIGRRKTAVARVRISLGEDKFLVNNKDLLKYFPTKALQQMAQASLVEIKYPKSLSVQVKVSGGGLNSQAEAVRLGTGRALVKLQPDAYKKLRKAGYLTRDPRMRERKKFGLKRARRAPQWQKR